MRIEDYLDRPEIRKISPKEEPVDRLIRKNFISMLKKKPVDKISVAALCEKCSINRSTFYRHYEDLYDLLDAITEQAHRKLFYDVLEKVDLSERLEDVGSRYILEVCEVTENNKELLKLLLFGQTPTKLRELMIESVLRLFEAAHTGPSDFKTAKHSSLHYRFLVNGMIGVWTAWLRADCHPEKDVLANEIMEELWGFYQNMHRLYGRSGRQPN